VIYFRHSEMPRKRTSSSPYEPLFYLIAVMWLVEIVNFLLGHRLCRYGILPRTVHGLAGIPLSPFLHAGVAHLLLNTGPLIVLGGLVLMRGRQAFARCTVFVTLVGGALLWIVGRPSFHVGASLLIFGYFGYLLARGVFDRRLPSLLIAILVVLAYGGLFWGMWPTAAAISWEGHLSGFLAGIWAARLPRRNRIP
jgi:membrane associated rhomboid family serine protease